MNKYRVESTRLLKYDYSRFGAYIITINCINLDFTLGQFSINNYYPEGVETGLRPVSTAIELKLSDEGRIIRDCWYDLPNHYKNLCLDEFIIMPNHVHGIIMIKNTDKTSGHGLPEFIWAFKSFSSRRINELHARKMYTWQRGYYDHVIKTDHELERIRKYFRNNPAEWVKKDRQIK